MLSNDRKSTAFNVNVSNASRGGSFHFAAIAAYRNKERCDSPIVYRNDVTESVLEDELVGELGIY